MSKMDILVCGNYEPEYETLESLWKEGHPRPIKKFNDGKKLYAMEQLILIYDILSKNHNIHLGRTKLSRKFASIPNTFKRTFTMMNEMDLNIVVINKAMGGVMMEHSLGSVLFKNKTLNFIKNDITMSGMIAQGTMLMEDVHTEKFENDADLIKKIEDNVKWFDVVHKIKNLPSK